MAVNLVAPKKLLAVDGVRLASVRAIKKRGRDDLTVMALDDGAAVCGVFTQNRFCAPPVTVCRRHLQSGKNIRALAINAGVANAGTLGAGLKDAQLSCKLLADLLGCLPSQVLPFSTGVIMERLPMQKYGAGLKQCVKKLRAENWQTAARAIMTTDTVEKGASRRAGKFTVTGIAKGSGMIHPQMATMLSFVATDAAIGGTMLKRWQREIADESFNAISVDGDTSTNDSFILIAGGKKGTANRGELQKIKNAVREVCMFLAEAIVRDGEGAQKLININVGGGKNISVCRKVADSIACSPLVKTALAAGDANVGRLLMAIGNGGGGFDVNKVNLFLGDAAVILGGGMHPRYNEKKAARVLAKKEINIFVTLGDNKKTTVTLKTCDLTHRYIEINADYRS